jgi:hypothetical protein
MFRLIMSPHQTEGIKDVFANRLRSTEFLLVIFDIIDTQRDGAHESEI